MPNVKRYPPVVLATCPIPWSGRFELEDSLFRAEIQRLRAEATPYLYIFGTAGEGYAVTDAQFRQVAEIFRAEMPAGTHAMVGIISLSLSTMIERIAFARELGFREFQISLPSWGALNDAEVDVFFRETCGRFPDCRFLHYNLMRSKRLLVGDDYARLVSAHSNLVAVKMGGEDLPALTDILAKAPALQCFFTDFAYAQLRDHHECGLLAAVSTVNLSRARIFFSARGTELAAMRDELRAIHRALMAAAETRYIDGGYDKLFVRLREPRFPLRLLPPYVGPTEAVFEKFQGAILPPWRI